MTDTSTLVSTTVSEAENKISYQAKQINTQEFNELTAEYARLKQINLLSQVIKSEQKLNNLATKDFCFRQNLF